MPSAKLTVDEFREIWFQNAADPPSFAKPRSTTLQIEGGDLTREGDEEEVGEEGEDENADVQAEEAEAEFLEEMVADRALEDEISKHLNEEEFQRALAEIDALRQESENKQEDEGTLSDLDDDDEVAGAIIDEASEHFILRAQLWMESNRDYLIEQREKRLREEEDERNGVKKNSAKRRRKTRKQAEIVDGESVPATPAESAKQMVKQRAFSKKIDYSAMDRLFADDS